MGGHDMGYTTRFKGNILFNETTTEEAKSFISSFFGEDGRDHPEWGNERLTYFDYVFNKDKSGICWSGDEKSYDMVEKLQLMIDLTKQKFPEFGFKDGYLLATGESSGDVWFLVVENDVVSEKEIVPPIT
jgi:hypothetical protein